MSVASSLQRAEQGSNMLGHAASICMIQLARYVCNTPSCGYQTPDENMEVWVLAPGPACSCAEVTYSDCVYSIAAARTAQGSMQPQVDWQCRTAVDAVQPTQHQPGHTLM